jgi:hypothetical protein
MASQTGQRPTNERILRLLEEVEARLVESDKRQERIARDLARLLDRA